MMQGGVGRLSAGSKSQVGRAMGGGSSERERRRQRDEREREEEEEREEEKGNRAFACESLGPLTTEAEGLEAR